MNKEIEQLVLKAEVGISNAIFHPEVGTLLTPWGYTPEMLSSGQDLLAAAKDSHLEQIQEYGDQIDATNELQMSRANAHHTYIDDIVIARIAFKNEPGMWVKLQLNGKRKRTYSGSVSQQVIFYTNLLGDDDALAKMAVYGVTAEKLQAGLELTKAIEVKLAALKKEAGEAQHATKSRDEAVDDLQEWYSDFISIARIALQSNPQYLEILGIIEPS